MMRSLPTLRGMHRFAAMLPLAALAVLCPGRSEAQAPLAGGLPGSWTEVNAFAQRVTNDFGDWSGAYARVVNPRAMDTFYGEVLALRGFREQGIQVGAAHRHDWNARLFHVIGVNVGDGSPILPRLRSDAQLGLRLGSRKEWQVTGGGSYVKSPFELYDVAATGSIAWFAPKALLLEVSGRYNTSQPGTIRSHRIQGVSILTPSPRRSFSLRVGGGSEGWQIISANTTLRRFHSQEYALAWREKLTTQWALSLQGDRYVNPFFSRTGVTLGVARYW
ncbi:MAG: YaiO family outer membrane beta-barrel protein [Gemmatimonadaceae bacterium]|nr:YaiO family outer membrane beta-barrel protein [Gemmatimonadaceae bacterium]